MRIVSIVGARPQFIKVAPISWRAEGVCDHAIIHTGQHYDPELSANFFSELEISEPIANLYSGSGSHAVQTARILVGTEEELMKINPDWVLVYGDTNSTIAATLAAVKLGIKVAHIEAGLRSFNRLMPEEINRIGTDHLSDLLFAPTEKAIQNLNEEGLGDKSMLVGDVVVETLNFIKERILTSDFQRQEKIFATIHRAENTDYRERLLNIIRALSQSRLPVMLYAHPRLLKKAQEFEIELQSGSITLLKPNSYFQTIKSILESVGVITDSGGIQKESYLLDRPCLTVRQETEWIETLVDGWNQLDPNLEIVETFWWKVPSEPTKKLMYGNGDASQLILGNLF